ncbi:LOW QUALITY PROTEIN: lysine-rich nucleolar protein 1 [Cygnus atratus]|uniref:LOW QUALITY PROTEIN: lysine-rich nucleolar protein 1 n=1 Tax=Cygnus atratus TaxID=8868 RepID=UPI0021B71C70|nr:LOW QUALITY PROTEIN: lysine-rich nucleolar protein 1 [Cygnus atratus]
MPRRVATATAPPLPGAGGGSSPGPRSPSGAQALHMGRGRMTVKRKKKQIHEEPAQKKKRVKRSGSQTIINIEKGVQSVIKAGDDDWFETKTKARKKESLKEDECLDQLNLKKKNKKRKVGSELPKETRSESFVNVESHLDLEQQEESEEQIKVFKKKRKKDRRLASSSLESNHSSHVELSNHYTDGTQGNELFFRKSRKNVTLNLKLDSEVTKKKKKKDVFSLALEDIQDNEYKHSKKDCKKTNTRISEEKDVTDESHRTDITQSDEEGCMRRKKRKKKKKKSDSFLPPAGNQGICGVHDRPIALSDFRKRQKKEITFTDKEEEDTTENSESIRETKKKKKNKKSKDIFSLMCEDKQEVESEQKEMSGKKCWKNNKDNSEVTKKKKKKKMQKDKETTYSEVSLSNDNTSNSQKITLLESNKKNKESEMKLAECVTGDIVDTVLCNSNHMLCDKKRKKRKKVPQDSAEESGSKANIKQKKIKGEDMGNEALEYMDDVTIVQEKKGNCDEVNIDKARRQALQEEIDRESGKTKVYGSKMQTDTKIGQWSTAAFQSSERGMKFLRLMGGFKKGSAPTQDLSATTNKLNMALNKEGEEKLQQALKMEFDKAMDLKQHRRIGLGFQPAANKKVYIDKYTSRSIKFED